MSEYTAIVKRDGDWWIGWIEEVPGVNCQESSRDALLETCGSRCMRRSRPIAPMHDPLRTNTSRKSASPYEAARARSAGYARTAVSLIVRAADTPGSSIGR